MIRSIKLKVCDLCYEQDKDTEEQATNNCFICGKDICDSCATEFMATEKHHLIICDDCRDKIDKITRNHFKDVSVKLVEALKPYLALGEL